MKPGDRVSVNDPALAHLQAIMRVNGVEPEPNNRGVIDEIVGDTAIIDFDDGVSAPYPLSDCIPEADPDKACEHEDFAATVDVGRLTDVEDGPVTSFTAAVRIECAFCHEKFRFMGMRAGMMHDRPMCSVDESEARLPIRPASTDPDFGLGIPGFAVSVTSGMEPTDRAYMPFPYDEHDHGFLP